MDKPKKDTRSPRTPVGRFQLLTDKQFKFIQNLDQTLSANIRKVVKDRHLKQAELVDILNPVFTDASHVSRVLSGKQPVKLEIVVAICMAFHLNIHEFIFGNSTDSELTLEIEETILRWADLIRGCKNSK